MNPAVSAQVRASWQVPPSELLLWEGKAKSICLVIPVINEGERFRNLLQKIANLSIPQLCDVLIVDGGSTDGSLSLDTLRRNGVRGLILKTGPGKLSAQLRCAYAFALEQDYEGIITIDGNGKDEPDAVPAFVNALHQGYDFVQASRFIAGGIAENTPASRGLAIRFLHAPLLSLCSGFRWTDTTQGFRAYSSRMLLDPRLAPFRHVFSGYELLAYMSYRAPRLGYSCIELPTTRRYPKGQIPTKISGIRGNLGLLAVLINACFGKYNKPGD